MRTLLAMVVILSSLTFLAAGCGRSAPKEPPPRTPEQMTEDMLKMNPPLPGIAPPAAAPKK